jgi:hypothetical protein
MWASLRVVQCKKKSLRNLRYLFHELEDGSGSRLEALKTGYRLRCISSAQDLVIETIVPMKVC